MSRVDREPPANGGPKSLLEQAKESLTRLTSCFATGALWLLLLVVLAIGTCDVLSSKASDRIPEVKRRCGGVIKFLDDYHKTHGRYPEFLPPSVSSRLHGIWPRVSYEAYDGGRSFVLKYGDYGSYGFELYWYSSKGEWYLDS